jgi:hypothetical protein
MGPAWASFGAMHARLYPLRRAGPLWVNDTHSALNRTSVTRLLEPRSVREVIAAVDSAARRGEPLLAAHPRLPELLAAKRAMDPGELFQSDWYRSMRALIT